MNFTHENYKKLNLIDFNVANKRKLKFYYTWRAAFQKRQKEAESKMHSVSRLAKLTITSQNLALRNKLCRWRDFVELRQYQGEALDAVLGRYKRREQRDAFVIWLSGVKAE
jgi:superfamily II DNA or RNA helicase